MSQTNTQPFSAETDASKEQLGELMCAELKVSLSPQSRVVYMIYK